MFKLFTISPWKHKALSKIFAASLCEVLVGFVLQYTVGLNLTFRLYCSSFDFTFSFLDRIGPTNCSITLIRLLMADRRCL